MGKPPQLKLLGDQLVAVDKNQTARIQRHRPSPPGATRTAAPVPTPPSDGAADACERATGAESPLPEGIECTQCGCAFVNTAAFDAHCPDGTCRKPPDVGLVVANRGVVWLESARHLERP